MKRSKEGFPFRFITFEGGEGAGKTTLIDHVEKFLNEQGFTTLRTREPGGTPFGNQIRSWLLDHRSNLKINPKSELMLFLAARAQHIDDVIQPAILAGTIVLCDRFNDSTIAYQGAGRELGIDWVSSLCKMVCGDTLPDLTFFLDVDPIVGLSRTQNANKENASSGQLDRIEAEKVEFHQKVRDAFIGLVKMEQDRFCCLDANQSKETVAAAAEHRLKYW